MLCFFRPDSDHMVIAYLRRHLTCATDPFHPLKTWPDGSLRLLEIPEVDLQLDHARIATKFGCHDEELRKQLCEFYADCGIAVGEPKRTFVNSHVYSCRLLGPHSKELLAAYTATAFEDATTGAPVLYVQFLAKRTTMTIGSASVGDLLFEHMRKVCMQCKPGAPTVHILTQSVGYTYDPDPMLDPNVAGALFWRDRLRITNRGLDYICCLLAAGEVLLKEDCVAMHRVFASAPSSA